MNPLILGAVVGHFVRDFLPAGLLPSLGGPAAQAPGVPLAQPPEFEEPQMARAPLGPIPLDEGISEDYERAVWNAYRDPNADAARIMGFSQALEEEGMPISAGVLRARVLELGRLREAMRVQQQIATQRASAQQARAVAQAREEKTAQASPPAPTEAPESPPVVAKPKKTGPRVRVTTPEPLTNGHNGLTEMPPPEEEENETPPAAARA